MQNISVYASRLEKLYDSEEKPKENHDIMKKYMRQNKHQKQKNNNPCK